MVGAGGISATPPCRFDDELSSNVRQAAEIIVARWPRKKGASAPFGSVRVNGYEAIAGSLTVEIVSDAAASAVDGDGCVRAGAQPFQSADKPDELTVLGVCEADVDSGARIRCSSGSIRALTAVDRQSMRASPALLYLLAHEVGHLRQERSAAFDGPGLTVDTSESEVIRWRQLRPVCQAPDKDQLQLEVDADSRAIEILRRALPEAPYRRAAISAPSSLYAAVGDIKAAAMALSKWEQSQGTPLVLPEALRYQTRDPAESNIERTATHFMCQMFGGDPGRFTLPNVPGAHPSAVGRLAEISTRMREISLGMPGGLPGRPYDGTRHVVGQLDDSLIPTIFLASDYLDRSDNRFYQALWPYLCTTYLNPGVLPDCKLAAEKQDSPSCPSFAGVLNPSSVKADASDVVDAVAVNGAIVSIPGRVRAVQPLGRGALVVGTVDPQALVWIGSAGERRSIALQCSPEGITSFKSDVWVLCDHPFELLAFSDGKLVSSDRLTTAYDGRKQLDPDQIAALWLGVVDQRLVGTARLDDQGTSSSFEIRENAGFKGALSLEAWRKIGCEQLTSSMALREMGSDHAYHLGSSLRSMGSIQEVKVSFDLRSIIAISSPETEGHGTTLLACGATAGSDLCVDVNGSTFDPFNRDQPSAVKFDLSQSLIGPRVTWARMCGTSDDVVLVVSSGNGTEIHQWRAGRGSQVAYRDDEPNSDVDVSCLFNEIIVSLPGQSTSKLVRMSGSSTPQGI